MNEADVGALCDLMQSLENAVLVMSTVFKDDKAKLSKKAKQLIGAAEKAGLTAELVKPGPQDAKRFAVEKPGSWERFCPRALRLSWWNAVGQTCLRWRAS